MSTANWGSYIQGNTQTRQIDEMGSKLSLMLKCAVHYPAYDKRIFECKCGVLFPVFMLEGQTDEEIIKHHKEGWRPE